MFEIKNFSTEQSGSRLSFGDHPFHLLVIFDGRGTAVYGGREYQVATGSAFFIARDTSFYIDWNLGHGKLVSFTGMPFEYFLLQVPAARGLGLFSQTFAVQIERSELPLASKRLASLVLELEHGDLQQQKMSFCVFIRGILSAGLKPRPALDPLGPLYGKFSSFLEANFRSQRNSGPYAAHLGVSMKKLNLLCRQWFDGKAFRKVLDQRLLSEAEYLLIQGSEPIKAIAYGLGFCSLQHFRGYFKKAKGLSPSAFRAALGNLGQ